LKKENASKFTGTKVLKNFSASTRRALFKVSHRTLKEAILRPKLKATEVY